MVSCSIYLASPGIFGSPDEPKLDLLSLESRDTIAVDQRDLSPGMVVHPVDATRGDEVARLNDKVLHANSIREKSSGLSAQWLSASCASASLQLRLPGSRASVQVDSVLPATVTIFLAPSDYRKRALISARMIPILAEGGMMGASS